jgi:hypothetical protein
MRVAADDPRVLARRECDQVVVAGVVRANRWRLDWIRDNLADGSKERDELARDLSYDPGPQLRQAQRSFDLRQKQRANDELDLAVKPTRDELRRSACAGEKCRDEDVRVEDEPHALAAPFRLPRSVLRIDDELDRLVLVHLGALPCTFEEVESEVATERFLDHIAVTPAGSRSLHAYGAHDALIESHGRSKLRHARIVAS